MQQQIQTNQCTMTSLFSITSEVCRIIKSHRLPDTVQINYDKNNNQVKIPKSNLNLITQ